MKEKLEKDILAVSKVPARALLPFFNKEYFIQFPRKDS